MQSLVENILNLVNPAPEISRRDQRVFTEGSPFYNYPLPILGAATWTGTLWTEVLWPDSRKYEPLDYIEVTNNDAVDLLVEIDTHETFPVPAGTVRGRVDRPFRYFRIHNEDAGTASVLGKVYVVVQRRPTSIDRWARGERS